MMRPGRCCFSSRHSPSSENTFSCAFSRTEQVFISSTSAAGGVVGGQQADVRTQHVRHARGVVLVHLAAEGLDVVAAGHQASERNVVVEGRHRTARPQPRRGSAGAAARSGALATAATHATARTAAAPAEHLHLVGDDLGRVAVAAFLVLPLARAQRAFDVDLRALAQVFARRSRPGGRTARRCATRCAPSSRRSACPSSSRWWRCAGWSRSCPRAWTAIRDRPRGCR